MILREGNEKLRLWAEIFKAALSRGFSRGGTFQRLHDPRVNCISFVWQSLLIYQDKPGPGLDYDIMRRKISFNLPPAALAPINSGPGNETSILRTIIYPHNDMPGASEVPACEDEMHGARLNVRTCGRT